ncbi:NAD+ synthase [Nitrospira defluvii]|nr:NAD+ synthase [Nitrospira defluvii]
MATIKRSLRIALAQINSTVGDLSWNLQKINDAIEAAREKDVDLIAFPEMAVTGYPPEDLVLKPHFIKDNRKIVDAVIEKSQGLCVILGFIDQDHSLFNAAAVIHNKTLAYIYHKCHLPNYGVFDENRYFSQGMTAPVFVLKGVTIGVNICEDIWTQNGPIQIQTVESGAKFIVNINASPYHLQKGQLREEMLARRAKENRVRIAYVNMVGGQDELVFDGGSLLFDDEGKLLARAPQFKESLWVFDMSFEADIRQPFPARNNTREQAVFRLPEIKRQGPQHPKKQKIHPVIAKSDSHDEEIYHALSLGLSDYVLKNRFNKGVIGLSGGIDSALTALLAVDALGKENVTGVFMPSRFTSLESAEDVQSLSRNLGIQLITLSIEDPFESTLSLLSETFKETENDTTEENLQSRIRGNLMMALSNKFGWLVLTTGNKSELSVGYATLYGDMAGGFAVIKDLWKTSVYRIAKMRNAQQNKPIPLRIFQRPPTAELRPDQCDQDNLPPYEILDPILEAYVEEDKGYNEILGLGFEPEIVSTVISLVETSEFKRRQAPVGIKITPRALGKDRRMPITNRYRSFHRIKVEHNDKITAKKRKGELV